MRPCCAVAEGSCTLMVMIVRVVAVWGHLTVDTPTCHNCHYCHYCRLQLHTLHRCWTWPYTYCTYCTIVKKVWPRVLVCCLWLSGLSLATTPGTQFWWGGQKDHMVGANPGEISATSTPCLYIYTLITNKYVFSILLHQQDVFSSSFLLDPVFPTIF